MTAVRAAGFFALALALAVLVARSDASRPTPADGSTVPGEVLVRFRGYGPIRSQIGPLVRHLSLFRGAVRIGYNERLDIWRFRLRDVGARDGTLRQLSDDADVVLAQPNFVYSSAVGPDDPLYAEKQQPNYAAINAPAGWAVETGAPDVVVAVIDGGVDVGHPDLNGHIWTNAVETKNGVDDDGNGCIDDLNGCSFQEVPPDGTVADHDGHGTFVAGIIGAETDNGEGVAGVAWNVTMMPVRALDAAGIGTTEQLADALLYAAMNGADIANLSLAVIPEGGTCPPDSVVEDVLRQAHDDYGLTAVAAAGNYNIGCVSHPAASQYAIAVSASGPAFAPDTRAGFSQWGPEVDVAAPGVDVVSTCPVETVVLTAYCTGEMYGQGNGTSFSAPFVSGLAALLLAQDPGLTNGEILDRLRLTARDVPDEQQPNWDGAGIIDAGAALSGGSAFAVVDASAPKIADLNLVVQVGAGDEPLCEAPVWQHPAIEGRALHGSLGVGVCDDYWPPTAERPWVLLGSTIGRKAGALHAVTFRREDAYCSAPGMPRAVTGVLRPLATVDCKGAGIVLNDEPSGAPVIDAAHLPRRLEEDVRYATSVGDLPVSCAGSFSRSVWYQVQAAGVERGVAVDTFGSAFDTVLVLYRGSPGALEEVACNEQFRGPQSRVVWLTDGSSTYYVMAAAFQTVPAGRLRVNFSPAEVPANDRIEHATVISPGDGSHVQPAHSATAGEDDPVLSCAVLYGVSVWFRVSVKAPAPLMVTTEGSDYDTVVGVFRDDGQGAISEVACNQNERQGVTTSLAGWDAQAGDYYVLVGVFLRKAGGVLRLRLMAE